MSRSLQAFLDDLPFETLPPIWTSFDLTTFSASKRLWDHQQNALRNALKALWKYYGDFKDYLAGEPLEANAERKERFFQWYRKNGLEDDLSIPLSRQKRDIRRLLADYYPVEEGEISYRHFINRMGFWMATGSGKTLVLVKLLELLWRLILLDEVPANGILVLTYQDDLLKQLKAHVDEFNAARGDLFIRLRGLKEYPEAKRESPSLFGDREITVFYYRSDNLSDEQKEKIIDFRNYDNNGQWYILLDEAHKGDKEDSKRQHIYSIMSRNGFLFNFSATFTDPRDIVTTAYDFNLARFIEAGYGKHISILKQENRAFRDEEDYTGEEKQKVVLKALIMLAYVRKAYDAIASLGHNNLYHKPLLLTLVNSVNTEDADLKLFFHELERIGKGEISDGTWQAAKDALWQELKEGPELLFEDGRFGADRELFERLTPQNVLEHVYNAPGPGAMEVWVRPSNRQEMAFKLKSADRPFALIKIGDISHWLKEKLAGYEVIEGFEDEGFFERLNRDDSDINILMGSRSFYEGWDSNRPNVITFINIGTGTSAKKFILQSVGRGVRIEPLPDERKRLLSLYNAKAIDEDLYRQIQGRTLPLETLFIFGTNRQALQTVIEQLDQVKGKEAAHEMALEINWEAVDDHPLLVPVYKQTEQVLMEQRDPGRFELAEEELDLLSSYVDYLGDDRLLLALHSATPQDIRLLRRCLNEPQRYFNARNGRRYGNLNLLLSQMFSYFNVVPRKLDYFKPLENEIQHFQHIKVFLEDITELQEKLKKVKRYSIQARELRGLYGKISPEEYEVRRKSISEIETFMHNGQAINIRHIVKHYYTPLILSKDEKIDYIRHIIRYSSEVRFINSLEAYLQQAGNRFGDFDWWLFSKLDETLDQLYIPYYDPQKNAIHRFIPDFIFWLQKGQDYFITFIDPKSIALLIMGTRLIGINEYLKTTLAGRSPSHMMDFR